MNRLLGPPLSPSRRSQYSGWEASGPPLISLRFKGPKKESHKRAITIDDDLVALLLKEREKLLRLKAGIPDGVSVDLSLIRLPELALMFPDPTALLSGNFVSPRDPVSVTKISHRRAKRIGFSNLRLHDLRGTHETLLLDRGVPVHVVAARCGHDPATLLRNYAKRTKKRLTPVPPASLAASQKESWEADWVQSWVQFAICSRQINC